MPPMRDSALFRLVVGIAATSLFATGCHGDRPVAPASDPGGTPTGTPTDGPGGNLSSLVPSGSVQSAIQQLPPAADGSITFIVRIVAQGVGVSAYQGAVTFVPGTIQLVSVSTPQGQGDEVYAVNSADFASGRIRFAACSATTFAGTDVGDGVEAFRFTVRSMGPLANANLGAALSVVGMESGVGLGADHLLGSPAVLTLQGR